MEDNKQTFRITMYMQQIKKELTEEEYKKIEKYLNGINKSVRELKKKLDMFE